MSGNVMQRNNVKIYGEGTQPMVFAHGFGCDQNMWRFVAPAFEKEYKIILFDYVGAGKSDLGAYNPERYGDLNGYAQDLLDICEELRLKDVILVAHSVSCIIGTIAAIKSPEYFSHLIMVGPSPRYINEDGYVGGFEKKDIVELLDTMERNYIGWANFLAPVIMQNADKPELTAELTQSFCSTDPVIARRFAEATFLSDNRQDLKKLQVPALVLQCSEDVIAPMSVGRYVAEHIPQSSFKVLEAIGHCPHMSHPEETVRLIREYLQERHA